MTVPEMTGNFPQGLGQLRKWFSAVQGEGLRAQLLRGGAGNLLTKVAAAGLQLITAIVLARLLGVKGFGIYSYVLSVISVLAIPAQFGLANLVMRETARAQVDDDWALLRGVWRWASAVAVSLSLLLVLASVSMTWFFSDSMIPVKVSAFYWGALMIPLVALGALRAAALRGLRHVVLGDLSEQIVRPVLFFLLISAFLWLWPRGSLAPDDAMALMVGATGGAFVLGAWLLARKRPLAVRQERQARYRQRAWLLAAMPLAFADGANLINSYADLIMLGLLQGDKEVGIYRVAAQGASLVIFGLMALNLVVAPHFARLHAQGAHQKLQQLVTRSAQVILALALPAVGLYVFFGDSLIRWFFGRDFSSAYLPLVILALGQLVNAAMGSVGFLLNMTGHEKDVTVGIVIAAVVNILLNAALIPVFGMTGAASATAISLAVWNIFLWHRVRLRLNINSTAFTWPGRQAPGK